MTIYLRLLEDPLEAWKDDLSSKLREFDIEVLSLDNYSESWLIKSCADQIREHEQAELIIDYSISTNLGTLETFFNKIPLIKPTIIYVVGKPSSIIEKVRNLKSIEIIEVEDGNALLQRFKEKSSASR